MQPNYGKSDYAPQWEYHKMTWETFLTIREWAQQVANAEGHPVYLVGSVLWKPYPRDLDISIIMPVKDFEARYGAIPDNESEMKAFLDKREYWSSWGGYQLKLQERIRFVSRVDIKITPDVWFADRDKLLLAEPNGKVRIGWEWRDIAKPEGK